MKVFKFYLLTVQFKSKVLRAGQGVARERAQWLRARAEDLGLIPNTYMVAHPTNASLRRSDAPFCPLQVLHAHGVQTHLQVHRYPTLIKK